MNAIIFCDVDTCKFNKEPRLKFNNIDTPKGRCCHPHVTLIRTLSRSGGIVQRCEHEENLKKLKDLSDIKG